MTDKERLGREYLADLLGVSPAELEETLNAGRWPEYRRPFAEAVRQLERAERLHRGPRPDRILVDDLVSDHGTGRALDVDATSPAAQPWQWWKSLRAQPQGVGLLPPELLPDRIRYAPAVEHGRHERSVQRWADVLATSRQTGDVARRVPPVPPVQQRRLVKFLDDWTRP